MDIKGKRLLILGGTAATLDITKNAKALGVYTVVTDNLTGGVAKELADETADVSTTDIDGLKSLIDERHIDGVFCGPSEFNIRNMISLCEQTGMRCYTDMAHWDICAEKDTFKSFCIEYGVDCPKSYDVNEESTEEELEAIEYPVIVKPVDSHSSNGINVCKNAAELRAACRYARSFSKSQRIIVEQYIENGGRLFSVRYLIADGEPYPYLLIDTHIADPIERKSLISHCIWTPSLFGEYYMQNMDCAVRKMLKGMGLKNGTAFFQALPYKGRIYFHEMGYRLSGGMLFKFTDPIMGINDMKMMIRYALGGEMCTAEELQKLQSGGNGKLGAQLTVPLNAGTIAAINGLEELKMLPCVTDFIQYYRVGDTVNESAIGTLGQHFCRFTMIADSADKLTQTINRISETLLITDTDGKKMNELKFDTNRLTAI